MFAPSSHTVSKVREWLHSSGVAVDRVTQSANKQWLQFDAEAGELEDLLKTEYHVHSHEATGNLHIACHE